MVRFPAGPVPPLAAVVPASAPELAWLSAVAPAKTSPVSPVPSASSSPPASWLLPVVADPPRARAWPSTAGELVATARDVAAPVAPVPPLSPLVAAGLASAVEPAAPVLPSLVALAWDVAAPTGAGRGRRAGRRRPGAARAAVGPGRRHGGAADRGHRADGGAGGDVVFGHARGVDTRRRILGRGRHGSRPVATLPTVSHDDGHVGGRPGGAGGGVGQGERARVGLRFRPRGRVRVTRVAGPAARPRRRAGVDDELRVEAGRRRPQEGRVGGGDRGGCRSRAPRRARTAGRGHRPGPGRAGGVAGGSRVGGAGLGPRRAARPGGGGRGGGGRPRAAGPAVGNGGGHRRSADGEKGRDRGPGGDVVRGPARRVFEPRWSRSWSPRPDHPPPHPRRCRPR